jgi:ATP-dependent helicase Lhr and Lhr-like helicase
VPGGFSAVYGVLKAMEESGRARRGYFVEHLGGAQFAVPGAIDRLRAVREARLDEAGADPVVLAATDPANPYGAALAWPDPVPSASSRRHTPRRVRGGQVVLVAGHLVLYVEKGGRSLLTFTEDPELLAAAAAALDAVVASGRIPQLRVQRIDGEDTDGQALVDHLRAAGFVDHPQGLIRRR